MSTLADAFLDDLDDLGDSGDEDEDQQDSQLSLGKLAHFSKEVDDLDDSDEGDGNNDDFSAGMEEENGGQATISPELLVLIGKIRSGLGIESIIAVRNSGKFKKLMSDITEAEGSSVSTINGGTLEDDQDYKLIVSCNKIMHDINDEFENIHRFVAEKYAKKFPELESLIPIKLDYIRTVQRMRNEMDMTMIEFSDILPSASVMIVSVTGSTTSGQQLTESELEECLRGCDEILRLEEEKSRILLFVESRMNKIAPNTCMLVGARIAAQLIGITGGLVALSKIPSCNLQVVGQVNNQYQFLCKFTKQLHNSNILIGKEILIWLFEDFRDP